MVSVPDPVDARHTLAALEETVVARRECEVRDLLLVAHWADLHAADPGHDPGPRPPGRARLEVLGGDGTPGVQDLALVELGIARRVHTLAARAVTADVLDLRHRLPGVWARVLDLSAEAWVARKVAAASRHLSAEQVRVVDAAVADAIAGQAPSRVLEIAEAAIIEADQAGHRARLEEQARRRYVALSRRDDTGLRTVIARVTAGDALWIDAVVDRVADILADRPGHDQTPRDLLRAEAFGWLARPTELLTLLLEHTEHPEDGARENEAGEGEPGDGEPGGDPEPAAGWVPNRALAFPADLLEALRGLDPDRLRPRTTLYVHLHQAALEAGPPGAGGAGIARVEGLGPQLLSQLADLLGHTRVRVVPVIDLADRVSLNCYEHPHHLKERTHLTWAGDGFPHATGTSRNLDHDHPVPYDPLGPPGQTGTHNTQPLGRTGHRAKTHLPYRATQLQTGEMLWRTPHGLCRLVDHHGTHPLHPSQADALTSPSTIEAGLARLVHRHHTGQLD